LSVCPPVTHEDVAIAGHHDIGGSVEHVGAFTCDAGLAERQQDLAVRTELDDLMALSVAAGVIGRPHVALVIDRKAVRVVE